MVERGPVVTVEGLVVASHSGANVDALRGVDLDIGPGEITALVGPNGAGKSTLLRALAGLERHRAGRVVVAGVTARRYRVRHGVGYLPENPSPSPGWTVSEWIRTSAVVRGSTHRSAAEAAAAMLSQLDLANQAGQRVDRLSRGTTRRAALALDLAGRPSLVVLDEPLSGLDPGARARVRNVVVGLRTRGATVVITAHELGAVPGAPDHTVLLDHGRVAARSGLVVPGASEGCRRDPRNAP